jgi:hypothetical protein
MRPDLNCVRMEWKQPQMPDTKKRPPIRAITRGPQYHWFGYYDKLEFDATQRYVLGMEVGFEGRSPTAEDEVRVGMVDLRDGDRWIELGTSRAWCWQQGCMLQWRPHHAADGLQRPEVMWNDRQGDQYVSHILDVRTGRVRTLPHPFYALSPDGRTAAVPDFRRINEMRPGYGYAGPPDPYANELASEDSGIWCLDLETGEHTLIVSLAETATIPFLADQRRSGVDLQGAKHYFNHLLYNTDGTRLEFLHRWRLPGQPGFGTRMLTVAPDGSNLAVIDDYGHTSHFCWRDPAHILAWAYHPSHEWAFYLYRDPQALPTAPEAWGPDRRDVPQGTPVVVGKDVMTVNGHCSYLPGNEWILNDTYPDLNRSQHLYLYHVTTGERVPLGSFHAPEAYRGEWRCDLHPRFSPDGRWVVVDSAHKGHARSEGGAYGRQLYLIDIGDIVDSN